MLSNAKDFHRSLYFHYADINKIIKSDIHAKKKTDFDLHDDFLTLSKILGSLVYFDDYLWNLLYF